MRIKVYVDNGLVYSYELDAREVVTDHISAIISGGYQHNDGKVLEHFPPHRIVKVRYEGTVETKYMGEVKPGSTS